MRRKVPKILQGYIDRSKAEVRAQLEWEKHILQLGADGSENMTRIAEIDRMLADMGDA